MLISSRQSVSKCERITLMSTITAANWRNRDSSAALFSADGASEAGIGVLERETEDGELGI